MNKRVAFRAIIFQGFDFSIHYFSQLFLTEINLKLYMYISSDGNDLCMNEMVAPTVPKTVRDLWQKKSPLSGGETYIQLLFPRKTFNRNKF